MRKLAEAQRTALDRACRQGAVASARNMQAALDATEAEIRRLESVVGKQEERAQ